VAWEAGKGVELDDTVVEEGVGGTERDRVAKIQGWTRGRTDERWLGLARGWGLEEVTRGALRTGDRGLAATRWPALGGEEATADRGQAASWAKANQGWGVTGALGLEGRKEKHEIILKTQSPSRILRKRRQRV
jgi:hypothetical protein